MDATEPVQRVLSQLQKVKARSWGWEALCPAHEDHRRSMTVRVGRERCALLKCQAGCTVSAIVAALGLHPRDLFQRPPLAEHTNGSGFHQKQIIATYDYEDATGKVLYQAVRFEPKDFRCRRTDGKGGWEWKIGESRVLFRLPDVLAAVKRGDVIYLVEGEKDALELVKLGLVATTNPNGAGKWQTSYSESLRDAHVVILPDNDGPGRQHAEQVAASLRGVARTVATVNLPELPPKGDVSDWLNGLGYTRADLEREVAKTPCHQPVPANGSPVSRCIADVEAENVSWLSPGRIALEKITIVEGDPGLGKTMVLLDLAARVTRGKGFPGDPPLKEPMHVVVMSGEDGVADTLRPRLEAAGADLTRIRVLEGVTKEGHEEAISIPADILTIQKEIETTGAKLVIIDVLNAYLGDGVEAYKDHHIRRALAPVKRMAEDTGAAIVAVRHLTKNSGGRSITAGGGSIGLAGAARSVLLVDQDPTDDSRRVLASVKCNLAAPPASLSFQVVESAPGGPPKIGWLGQSAETADTLAMARAAREGDAEEKGKVEEAAELLRGWLEGGEVEKGELTKLARGSGFSASTLDRAAADLKVVKRQQGCAKDKRSYWSLPSSSPNLVSHSISPNLGEIERPDENEEPQGLTPPRAPQSSQSHQLIIDGENEAIGEEALL